MANQQEEVDALVEEFLQTIVAEVGELKKLVDGLEPGKPLDLSKLKALKAKVQTMSDEVKPAAPPPTDGTHNITVGFRSSGDESFTATFINTGVDDERAAQLRAIYDGAKSAAAAQAKGGANFSSAFHFGDNGKTESFEIDNEAQKSAADVVMAEALLQIALAQNAEFHTATA